MPRFFMTLHKQQFLSILWSQRGDNPTIVDSLISAYTDIGSI